MYYAKVIFKTYKYIMPDKELLTIIVAKPAKSGKDYQFTIPRKYIRTKTIDPEKYYELRIHKFDEDK